MWQIFQVIKPAFSWIPVLTDHWGPVAISGNRILAVCEQRLWYFNGSAWSEQQPAGNANKTWIAVGISGTRLVAAVDPGYIYYNDGSGWVEQSGTGKPGYRNWQSVSIDGDKILAVSAYVIYSYVGMIWYFDGSSWHYIRPNIYVDINYVWQGCAISANHAVMTKGMDIYYFTGGDITDWGNWSSIGFASANDWYAVDISDDNIIVGALNPGRLWHWDGASWAEIQPAGDVGVGWRDVGIYGNKMVASSYGNQFYYYNGTIWALQDPVGDGGGGAWYVDIDSNAIVAGERIYGGGIYPYGV